MAIIGLNKYKNRLRNIIYCFALLYYFQIRSYKVNYSKYCLHRNLLHDKKSSIPFHRFKLNSNPEGYNAGYLQKIVNKKKIAVETLLRKHQEPDDPLVMRMSYMASECKYLITKALKLDLDEKDSKLTIYFIFVQKNINEIITCILFYFIQLIIK